LRRKIMASPKFASGLWVFGGCVDRFCAGGYKPKNTIREQIELASKVKLLKGVEAHQSDFDTITPRELKRLLADTGLACTLVNTEVWGSPKWMHGAFTHRSAKTRREAIAQAKRSVDCARAINCPGIGLWLGADGFDYPFQVDYRLHWEYLVEGIREVAEYAQPDITCGIEYKLKEPRTHMTIGDVGKALWLAEEVGLANVGVAVDFGHALMSRESPADSVCLLARKKKLFNVHFNDAYREWDDDMIVGVVHFWETLEFLYYCKLTGYDGWFGLDMFPYREDGVKAADMALRNLRAMWRMLDKIDEKALVKAQRTMDAVATQEVVRKVIFS
jgi:xylose isomerase